MYDLYADGMLGRESLTILRNVSQLIAAKIDEFTLHMRGYIGSWIANAVTSSYL